LSALLRHPRNPILTRADIPDVPPRLADATSVFNPGAVRFRDRIVLLLRVQARSRETFLMAAESADGIEFSLRPQIVELKGVETVRERVYHVYDPRITAIDGAYIVMVAMDMDDGCRLGVARTQDFEAFEFLGLAAVDDVRNGVLFPETFGDRYLRFDRPNTARLAGGPTSGSTIWLSESEDLLSWKPVGPVAAGRFHYWDELIGSGPPPVKTREGWLHVYHGVATHFGSANIYQVGVMLHDIADPSKVLGRSRCNILEPREIWELAGQVPNVVFPSGIIVDDLDEDGFARPSSPVKIYYGAADTVVGLAETTIADLLEAARELPLP
jgi:beta-1,4-mannooligosaccharide/beta-1,4-mannosyl-N-acetylglucosamine phosphorylase